MNRHRGFNLLEGAAAAVLVLYPPLGAGLLFIRGFLIRKARPNASWLAAWGGLLLLGLVVLVRYAEYGLLLQAAMGALAGSFLLVLRRRAFFVGLLVGLGIVLATGFAERERSRVLWSDAATPQTTVDLIAGISKISGDSPGWRRNGVRLIEKKWLLAPGTNELELSVEMRSQGGESGWQWYTNSSDTRQVQLVENGVPFTRVTGWSNYIVRRARTEAPLAERTVRASLELRASAPVQHEGCGLQLRSFEPSFSICEPLHLGTAWQPYEITFHFPPEAPNEVFELSVAALGVDHLDIRALEIEVRQRGEWVPLAPIEPEGVQIRFPLAGLHLFDYPSLHALPTEEWQVYTLSFEHDSLASTRELTGHLQLEGGNEVELRNVSLTTSATVDRQPLARPRARSDLWFEQANLAGHTFGTLGFLALILTPATGATIIGFFTLLSVIAAVFLSGSRTAWIGAILGGGWLIWLRSKSWQRIALAAMALAVALLLTFTGGSEALGRLQLRGFTDGNNVTRTEIWQTAWYGFLDAPILGKGPNGFSQAWQEHRPGDLRGVPDHAHNLWLGFAVNYGSLGLMAILWLTGSLLWLAWRWGRWRGLALITPVLVMNMFDDTLFYAGVLYPLLLGVNSLSTQGSRKA